MAANAEVNEGASSKLFYSVAELSALTTLSKSTIRRLIHAGKLRAVRYGQPPRFRTLIPAAELGAIKDLIELTPPPLDLSLATEVRALVARLQEVGELDTVAALLRDDAYYRKLVAHGFEVWEGYLKDPAHPDPASLTWMREWLVQTGEYWVNSIGYDPLAQERAWGLSLLDRMLASAVPHAS